jgi:dipeptidase
MCDTMVAATATGMLFAKNSDRERNEAQYLDMLPARGYGAGATLRCTYIAISQAAHTHAVLLSRPCWIWGAEMGANEHGVVIGNEAVHPRATPQRRPALLGMDLLRLGLERSASAAEAVTVITGLLEAHGQGGSAGHLLRRWYDNSFLIADSRESFVLETVGRHWAVEKAGARRAISNTYSIATPERMSAGLKGFVREQDWWSGRGAFDFAASVTNPDNPGLAGAIARCGRSTGGLAATPAPDAGDMMGFLRDHGGVDEAGFHPQDLRGPTVCMHAGDGGRRGQSVGSLVSDLRADGALHWVTGTSAPCTSIFKPVFLDAGLPEQGPVPGDRHDVATLWWRHEQVHRALLLGDHAAAMAEIAPEREATEAEFRTQMEAVRDAPAALRKAAVDACWACAGQVETRWLEIAARHAGTPRRGYANAWGKLNALAGWQHARPMRLVAESVAAE